MSSSHEISIIRRYTVALQRQSVQRLVDLKTSQKEATEKVGLEAERWVCVLPRLVGSKPLRVPALNSAGARQGSSREASDCSRDSCKGLESHSGHGDLESSTTIVQAADAEGPFLMGVEVPNLGSLKNDEGSCVVGTNLDGRFLWPVLKILFSQN